MQTEERRVIHTQSAGLQAQRRTTLISFLTLLVISFVLVLAMIAPYLLAVTMGGILALLTYPIYQKLRRRRLSSQLSSTLVTLGVVLLIIIPITLLVALSIQQGTAVAQALTENEAFSFRSILDRLSKWTPIEAVFGSPEALERQARSWIQGAGKTVTTGILGVAAQVPKILLQLALASIACFFLLIDGKKLLAWTTNKIPLDSDVRSQVLDSFQNTAISVIWATLAAAGAQSGVMLLSFLILGVPAAFLAAGVTFIFAWIPILGSTPVWLAGAIYLYTQGSVVKTIFMVVFGLLTGVVDNFVRPMVLKGRNNMHPLVSLVAIFGGIGAFGIMGIFIGPIFVAVVISLLQIWPAVGRRFGLLPPQIEGEKPIIFS